MPHVLVKMAQGHSRTEKQALTDGPLFRDLWRRQDLAPRDRSLMTIVALTADGDADQLGSRPRP